MREWSCIELVKRFSGFERCEEIEDLVASRLMNDRMVVHAIEKFKELGSEVK